MKAFIEGNSIKIRNEGNASALLLEWISFYKKDRVTLKSSRINDGTDMFLLITIYLGATSGYSIPWDELKDCRDYINNEL